MKALRDSFAEILQNVGKEDQNLVVLVGDISHFRLQPFAKECPGRYYNIGICEQTIVNMAAGLSKVGLYPVVHTISPFIVERSFEQLKLDFCYQRLGGNILTVGSAFDYANLGCTHHCYSDFALLKTLSDTQLLYPATSAEFDRLFRQTYNNNVLTYFRLPMSGHSVEFKSEEIIFGKGIKVASGNDLTIVAVGSQLKTILESFESLKRLGLNADLIYVHTVKPLDHRIITESISKTQKCLVIEEHGIYGGVYADVVCHNKDVKDVKYASIAIPNRFIREYGTYEEHCRRLGFSIEGVMEKIKN